MVARYVLVGLAHLLSTALVLKIFSLILPCFIICQYTCAANFLMLLIVARLTFGFTKRNFLNERIQPYNKAVIITGCDTGFGNALAKKLDSQGYHVFASCYNENGDGAASLRKDCTKRLQVLGLDVTSDGSVKKAVEFVKENLGTSELWAVVNNAGIFKGFSVEFTSMQEFKDTLEVNTFGMVRVTKAFLPFLRQSRGRVVNVISLAGRIAEAHMSAYAMSKHAAVAFSNSLRQEMDVWGVKVISIEPEFFQTQMTNINTLVSGIDKTCESVDKDVIADYGEKYLKNLKIFMEYTSNISSPKVYKVLNAIDLAISLEHPDTMYRPSRNIVFKLFYSLVMLLPDVLKVVITSFYFYAVGFPKPKEADNTL